MCELMSSVYSSIDKVQYEEAHFIRLAQLCRDGAEWLDSKDRLNLIEDSFALARAGYHSTIVPLKVFSYFVEEKAPYALATLIDFLSELWHLLPRNHPAGSSIARYIQPICQSVLKRFGFDTRESDLAPIRNVRSGAFALAVSVKETGRVRRFAVDPQ